MKKQIALFIRENGGTCMYKGAWPQTMFIMAFNKEQLLEKVYRRFGKHTQIKFV